MTGEVMVKRSIDEARTEVHMNDEGAGATKSETDASLMDIDKSDGTNQTSSRIMPPKNNRRNSLMTLLRRPSPFGNETGSLPCGEFIPQPNIPYYQSTADIVPSDDTISNSNILSSKSKNAVVETPLSTAKVLVVGAGGLGCEILKDLAMSGIRNVHVIDLDTIDVTNLNRQFLFRQKDVGQSKAVTAANFINTRCPWMNVTPHYGKIQDKSPDFYQSFQVVISGLDNVEARRWLNATIVGLVTFDDDGDIDPSSIIPIIDGGTEAFSGQARLILPRITSCFECTIDSFPPQTTFPLCTIAETPRRPEHCIAYAFILQWPKEFPNITLDKDSPEHMRWVYEKALDRSQQYNISGVTYMLTMGVVKNIIPAVASTNAIIAAACVNETIKYITFCSQSLNSYMMYMGSEGIHTHTFVYEQKEDCPVCTSTVRKVHVSPNILLKDVIQIHLKDSSLRLSSPSIVSGTGKTLYMPKPPMLEEATRPNLDKCMADLILDGEEITVTDPILESIAVSLSIHFGE